MISCSKVLAIDHFRWQRIPLSRSYSASASIALGPSHRRSGHSSLPLSKNRSSRRCYLSSHHHFDSFTARFPSTPTSPPGAQHNKEAYGRRDEDRQDAIMEQLRRCLCEFTVPRRRRRSIGHGPKQDIKSGKELPIVLLLAR
jgi:hypothetical protein